MLRTLFNNKKVFIPFIMAGHPSMETTRDALHVLSKAHVDVIELGVPFSDPVADGVVNQRAATDALKQGTTLSSILHLVQSVRLAGVTTPIILFSYFNPILAFGLDAFARDAKAKGVDGVLVVDLPPEEGVAFYTQLKNQGLDVILLMSPTTNTCRFELFQGIDPAFIYYISRRAVTGMQKALPEPLHDDITAIKRHFPDHPIAVGFGISTTEQAHDVAQFADGVVVGSALVNTLEKEDLSAFQRQVVRFIAAVQSRGAHDAD